MAGTYKKCMIFASCEQLNQSYDSKIEKKMFGRPPNTIPITSSDLLFQNSLISAQVFELFRL